MCKFLAGINFLSLFDRFGVFWYDNDVFLFSDPWDPFLGFRINKIDIEPITVLVILSDIMLKMRCFFCVSFFYLIVCLCLTSLKKLRSYRDGATA